MMLEIDLLYAYVKKTDWLKPAAEEMVKRIVDGRYGTVHASREALHELYYVSMAEGVSLDDYIARAASVTAIANLEFHPTTAEVDLLAFTLMKQYRVASLFDAYHAATALNQEPDHSIVSTDVVFDKIPGITRIDPTQLVDQR
jgi:predicted nucleic acid-binding protein